MDPLIHHPGLRWMFLIGIVVLLLAAFALVPLGWVKVKMLPCDNKNEFQIILNMPEGSALEKTAQAALEIGEAIRVEPEITDYQIYAGTASPFNFNGLVRHYFARQGASVADIQVNLLEKHKRKTQSHDIAKRVRPRVKDIADKYGARIAVAEVPPGPPVLQTLVAEIYGPNEASRMKLATQVREIFKNTPGVVDVDWYVEADQPKTRFVVDKEKASLNGISAETISQTLRIAVGGQSVDLLHIPREKEDINLVLEIPRSLKTTLKSFWVSVFARGCQRPAQTLYLSRRLAPGPLRELVSIQEEIADKSIYHKNLMPVTYVIGDAENCGEPCLCHPQDE